MAETRSNSPSCKALMSSRVIAPLVTTVLSSDDKLPAILGGRFMIRFARFVLVVLSIVITTTIALAQQYDQNLFFAMKWRLVGPHRAGRVTAVAGIPGNAKIYYFGTPGGGLWKTTDGGRVWKPIF